MNSARKRILSNIAIDYVVRYTDCDVEDIRPGTPKGHEEGHYIVPILSNVRVSQENGVIRKPDTWSVILDATGHLIEIR